MKNILIVEHNQDLLFLLTDVLTKAGFEVTGFVDAKPIMNGRISLPDVFILDAEAKPIDGLAICKYLRLKDLTKQIPVIIISSNHGIEKKAADAGTNSVLRKPFEVQQLLEVIESHIYTRSDVTYQTRE